MSEARPRAFVTGWPIGHSRSPLIHGHWLRHLGLPGSYEAVAVEPDDFPLFLDGLREAGFVGGNVTIPHKEAAFAGVHRRDGDAQAIGAVNTLWFEGDALVGGNTDAFGFAANLDEGLAGWRQAREALVLGAGGAARAVVHALLGAGIGKVRVVNRTRSRAEALAQSFGRRVSGHGEDEESGLLGHADLLVNTRPSSEAGGEGGGPIDLSPLADQALVTDIVYVPLETPVLRAARARGLRTQDGLGMLLHQAVPGFERWFGHRPQVTTALRETILKDL